MAFPTNVSTTSDRTFAGSIPYLSSGGNVYVVTNRSDSGSNLRVFKATDPTSSFSQAGSDLAVTSGNAIVGIATYQVSDDIYIVTADGSATALDLRFHIFSMSSDSFTTSNELIKDNATPVTVDTNSPYNVTMSVRSDGDVIVLYNGNSVANMGSDRERVYYARRESGSWTIDVAVDNGGATNWLAGNAIIGASDRMHFFFTDDGASDGYQRRLNSDNTMQTFPSAFDTAVNADNFGFLSQGASYDSSGTIKVRCPYYDGGADIASAKLDSADTPSITTDTDITGATVVGGASGFRFAFAADGTTLWHAFPDGSIDIYTQSNANDGGWSTPELFLTTSAERIHTNIYTRGSDKVLAFVFGSITDDTTKYHEKVLQAGGSTFTMSAAASATFTGASTAAVPFSQTTTASVTWGGNGLYPAALSAAAVASVTWNGAEVAGATAADWSSAAATSVTWGGTGLYPAALSSTAAASLTWNGAATGSSDWSAAAVAALTWNGASEATSAWNSAAVASLTWNGTGLYPAALSSTAVASLTWNGAGLANADLNAAAAGSLTWNGISTAASALNSTAVASLTWNGAATATGSWSSISAASLTWNGASTATADWSAAAAATLTWNGQSLTVTQASFSITAIADQQWNGASTASSDWSSAALANLTWNGISTATSAWNSAAAASVTWNSAGAITEAEFSIIAAAVMTMAGASTASANLSSIAAASLTWNGTGLYPAAWNATAVSALTTTGAAIAAGAFTSSALANLQALGASTASGDWLGSGTATLTGSGQSTVAGDIVASAAGSLTWNGQEVGGSGGAVITAVAALTWSGEAVGGAAQNLDGWLPKPNYDQQDMEDIQELFNLYMAQYYGYY